jgi:hypothetical protein
MAIGKRRAKAKPVGDDLDDVGLSTERQFLAFVEAQGGGDLDPLSDEALRLQAQYVAEVGDHPLDVLKTLSANIFVKPSERIAAAKALLEYGARKVPAQLQLSGIDGGAIKLDASALSKLSDKELVTLETILAKAGGPKA